MENKIFTFLQKNYGWIVAIITGISICTSFVLRFIKYVYSVLYFNYYGISYGLFNNGELGILYNFCISILLMLCFYSLIYCYKQLYDMFKNREKNKNIIINMFLILISNLFIIFSAGVKISFWQFILNNLVLIIIEVVVMIIFAKMIKKQKEEDENPKSFFNYLKVLPFYLILLILLFSTNYLYSVMKNKSYNIINDNKVIVYTTNDYYVILDCDIKDNELTIYKGNQMKVNNENVESKLINFDKVKIK